MKQDFMGAHSRRGKEMDSMSINDVGMEGDNFGGMSARGAALVAVGVIAAIAGAAAAVGAARIDQLDRSSDAAEMVAGIALFASAVLVAVVALARTRLAVQEAEIERLRARVLDAELRSEWGVGEEEWEDAVLKTQDAGAEQFVLRLSER